MLKLEYMPEDNKDDPPLKKMFQRWEETRPLPKNYDVDPPDVLAPPNIPRGAEAELGAEYARRMAIKLAQEEKETIELAREFEAQDRHINGLSVGTTGKIHHVSLITDQIKQHTAKTLIEVVYYSDIDADNSEAVGVKTPYVVVIYGMYSDKDTLAKFLEYSKTKRGKGNAMVKYYFNEKGEYGKIQKTDKDFENGKPKYWTGEAVSGAVLPMQPEDFEMASAAIGLIKEQLKAHSEPESPVSI